MISKTLVLLILLVTLSTSKITKKLKVDPKTQLFVDEDGLEHIFHGVNVVYKPFPFYPPNLDSFDPDNSFAKEDLLNLKKWGMNVIRLHVAWEGVEPARGTYNMTYLAQLKKIVQMCA
jgi:endoglycosylceramidase